MNQKDGFVLLKIAARDASLAIPPESYIFIRQEFLTPLNEETIVFGEINNTSEQFSLISKENNQLKPNFPLDLWLKDYISEDYREEFRMPSSAKLPSHYHYIPGVVRNFLAKTVLKSANTHLHDNLNFNYGPEFILKLLQKKPREATLVLTHDIDTTQGFEWIKKTTDVESSFQFKSAWNFVPYNYKVKERELEWLLQHGHEVGLHGLWHTNREAFLDANELKDWMKKTSELRKKYRIQTYRGPSWYRTTTSKKVLSEFFSNDLTDLDLDNICPGGGGGVGIMRPFFLHGQCHLPCTLPLEVPMLKDPGCKSLLVYWREKIDFLIENNLLLVINTHPDPNYSGNERLLEMYREVLEYIHAKKVNCSLPRDFHPEGDLLRDAIRID